MKVSEAVDTRLSVRAFLDEPPPREMLERVLRRAARAPSGGNLQPWLVTVLQGEALERFRAVMEERLDAGPPDEPEYPVYPPSLHEPYRSRRFKVGEDMYALLGIARDEKPKRWAWFRENFRFFGAPAALFCHVDRRMGAAQWSDLGMFLQTVMLLLREEGWDTCAQEAWGRYHRTVDAFLETPPDRMLFCGMAIGRRDPAHPVNRLRAERAPLEEWARFL
jgi:nitroreductase